MVFVSLVKPLVETVFGNQLLVLLTTDSVPFVTLLVFCVQAPATIVLSAILVLF